MVIFHNSKNVQQVSNIFVYFWRILTVGQAVASVSVHPISLQHAGPFASLVDLRTGRGHQQQKHHSPHNGRDISTAAANPFYSQEAQLESPCLFVFSEPCPVKGGSLDFPSVLCSSFDLELCFHADYVISVMRKTWKYIYKNRRSGPDLFVMTMKFMWQRYKFIYELIHLGQLSVRLCLTEAGVKNKVMLNQYLSSKSFKCVHIYSVFIPWCHISTFSVNQWHVCYWHLSIMCHVRRQQIHRNVTQCLWGFEGRHLVSLAWEETMWCQQQTLGGAGRRARSVAEIRNYCWLC